MFEPYISFKTTWSQGKTMLFQIFKSQNVVYSVFIILSARLPFLTCLFFKLLALSCHCCSLHLREKRTVTVFHNFIDKMYLTKCLLAYCTLMSFYFVIVIVFSKIYLFLSASERPFTGRQPRRCWEGSTYEFSNKNVTSNASLFLICNELFADLLKSIKSYD